MADFLTRTVRVVLDTSTYLLAYRMAPLIAIAVAAALAALAPQVPWIRRDGSVPVPSTLAVLVRALTIPATRDELARTTGRLAGRPFALVSYLTVSHNLTVYYLLLIGPLLGKDVLLSHAIGGVFFVLFGGVLVSVFGSNPGTLAPSRQRRTEPPERRAWSVAGREVTRALGSMVYGLLIGGAIAAWGLGPGVIAPVDLLPDGWPTQLGNALLGVGVSFALWMWPISNLFVGTFLWKVGLAHAGLVVFFYASVSSPQRLRLYRDVYGAAPGTRLAVLLALSAVLAGLAAAILYRFSDLAINYKLVPEQMW